MIGKFSSDQGPKEVNVETEIVEKKSALEEKLERLEKEAKLNLERNQSVDQKLFEIQKLREEVFQIFLADVALKLDQKFWKNVNTAPTIATSNTPIIEPKTEETVPSQLKTVEQAQTQVQVESNVENTLNGALNLKDPNNYFSNAVIIKNGNSRLMKYIQGVFKGSARVNDTKRATWNILINSQLHFSDSQWTGSVNIELSDDRNNVFSNSSGNGDNNNFYQSGNDKNTLIVKASPNIYLNLKWIERRQIFSGSIYKKKDDETTWKLIGKIQKLSKD